MRRAGAGARRAGAGVTRALLAGAALLVVLLPGAPAWAHTELLGTTPAKGATVTKAPAAIALKFSQSPNPDFTQIVVSDAAKQPVPVSRPAVEKGTAKVTFTSPPANGVYTVAYRIVSSDGHTVKGSYTFTVADPAQPSAAPSTAPATSTDPPTTAEGSAPANSAPANSAAPIPAAENSPDDEGGLPTGALIGLGAVVAAGAAAGVLFALRRKRTPA
jgi:methionine-rich copper-binding protein CopC